jgi:hypothetical protein
MSQPDKAVAIGRGDWDAVPQQRPASEPLHPMGCTVALTRIGKRSPVRFIITVGRALTDVLGWYASTRLELEIGRGDAEGWVRVLPSADGRPLRRVPRGHALYATLVAGPLEEWVAEREAPEFVVLESLSGLMIRLPWDFLPAEEAAADAADEA